MLLKRIPKKSWPMILVIGMACVLLYTINLRFNATSIGGSLGGGLGTAAGRAAGSLEGITKGRSEGIAEGKSDGLSAEDTEATIENELRQLERLEVLVASVKLSNFHTIGEKKNYAALYLVNGNVVFTVDMSQAQVTDDGSNKNIVLPKPVGELKLDDSTVEKAAEYQTKLFNGSAEDGFDAYLNTMKKVQEASEETLDNYDVLVESAEEAAERQVTRLVQAVSSGDRNVVITFAE